jgi:hypothetical protein
MASVNIDSGELPSAEGVEEGYPLSVVIGKWQSIACIEFPNNCEKLIQMIDETDRLRLWEKNVGGFTFESRNEFLQNKVLIDFGLTEQALNEIVGRLTNGEEVKMELRSNGGDRKSESFQPIQSDNVRLITKIAGNRRDYTLARLERDRPDLAMQVRQGSMSANAAAIEAGFRKPPPSSLESLFQV